MSGIRYFLITWYCIFSSSNNERPIPSFRSWNKIAKNVGRRGWLFVKMTHGSERVKHAHLKQLRGSLILNVRMNCGKSEIEKELKRIHNLNTSLLCFSISGVPEKGSSDNGALIAASVLGSVLGLELLVVILVAGVRYCQRKRAHRLEDDGRRRQRPAVRNDGEGPAGRAGEGQDGKVIINDSEGTAHYQVSTQGAQSGAAGGAARGHGPAGKKDRQIHRHDKGQKEPLINSDQRWQSYGTPTQSTHDKERRPKRKQGAVTAKAKLLPPGHDQATEDIELRKTGPAPQQWSIRLLLVRSGKNSALFFNVMKT